MASTPELSLECRLREFLMRVSQMKHLGHNEFPFEDVSCHGVSSVQGRIVGLNIPVGINT